MDLTVGDVEYNFDIDANTGSIVSWDQELTDRSLYAGQNSTNTDSSVNYHHSEIIMMMTTGTRMTGMMTDFSHIYLKISGQLLLTRF